MSIFKQIGVWLALSATAGSLARAEAPISAAQIEADWLLQDARRLPRQAVPVSPESDAAGAVDGVKDGRWGFHTQAEPNPWWQVDLGAVMELDHVVVWNRCDAGMAERNFRIILSTSVDGKSFERRYQHDGSPFYGQTDGKPLSIALAKTPARFVRLSLQATSYFHLDEVEVFAAGTTNNVALGKPATQSSVSPWSVAHLGPATGGSYPVQAVVDRGLKLAASLKRLGVNVDAAERTLQDVARATATAGPEAQRELYMRARWTVRGLALSNPLLDFDALLFVKRAPGMFPHMSDQHYGWWSRGGGGVYVLEGFKTKNPRLKDLTADMPLGSFMGPDLAYEGDRLLFGYCQYFPELANEQNKANKDRVPEPAFYHVYEMKLDGTGRRQLTHGKYDDFDARYLPGGDLVFVSTRKGTAIQCSQWFSDATRENTHPDSYVRCGGDNYRPVPVFTLHGMDANGRNIRPLSAFENFEWTPSVANDGRILYTRWDYIDRFNGHFFSLWSANQDGSNPQFLYGNYSSKPQVKIEARSVPGSSKMVFTASAHHSIYGGSLCLLDRAKGTEGDAPITRLTPDVPFPETEANAGQYFANPWPLSEEYFLVAWSDQPLPPHCRATEEQNPRNATGIYLADAFGNLELLHRDPVLSSASPIPVKARVRPPVQSALAQLKAAPGASAEEGQILLQDVYQGLPGVKRGAIKELRVIGVPPKVQPHMNQPNLGVSAEDPGKFVLGTVPVEADGSAYFRVPAGVPLFFQALDEAGLAVQTMRTLTYAMPGQTLSCVGCHEHRESAPPAQPLVAARREPSRILPGPTGSWPLKFDTLVQPVLNRSCVECHQPGSKDVQAAKLDLTPAHAYDALLRFGQEDLRHQAFERDRSYPGQGTAANSRLWKLLTQTGGHQGVKLNAEQTSRLLTWMDTYAQRTGHFSADQEAQLAEFRRQCAPLLEESESTR